ncbi:tRNA threonylcarbamoyladenosine dehydratase [Christensenellaceae bacterium OttesenSCG-928-L17]|nr:tRNA threonylcarbamoyladenosine dehydratase [Christensenellaceae bacterium OttesenSCG-928-L17]
MSTTAHTRTRALLGEEGLLRLQQSHVAVIGLGGVGGHCAEALARSGIGRLLVLDADVVEESNLNRQLIATKNTLGTPKAAAMRARIEEISDCRVNAVQAFLLDENVETLLPDDLDFIVDAVDTVAAKLALVRYAFMRNIPIVSAMGAGNRLDPSAFYVTDIYKTEGCPLARAVRQGCRKLGVEHLAVVVSRETPVAMQGVLEEEGRRTPGSVSFVPGAAGLVLAGYVVRTLAGGTCASL